MTKIKMTERHWFVVNVLMVLIVLIGIIGSVHISLLLMSALLAGLAVIPALNACENIALGIIVSIITWLVVFTLMVMFFLRVLSMYRVMGF